VEEEPRPGNISLDQENNESEEEKSGSEEESEEEEIYIDKKQINALLRLNRPILYVQGGVQKKIVKPQVIEGRP